MISNSDFYTNKIFIFFSFFLFLLLSLFFNLSLFGDELFQDGFYSQIYLITSKETEFSGLDYMYFARFLAIFPFYQIWLFNLPNYFNAFFLSLFLMPFLSFNFKGKSFNYLKILILFLPFFFSIRISLAACGLGYLYIYLYGQNKNVFLILFSFLFSLLGSGSVLVFFLILFFNRKKIIQLNPVLRLVGLLFMLFIILSSLVSKYNGFSNGDIGFSNSGKSYEGLSSIYGMVLNGTMVLSFQSGNYIKGFSYLFLFILGSLITFYVFSKSALKEKYFGFFAPMLVMFWFEGITFISYQYCVLFILIDLVSFKKNSIRKFC